MFSKKIILLSVLLLTSCGGSSSGDSDESIENDLIENSSSKVFISKGDTQCNDDGLRLDETASFLSTANITIEESECGIINDDLDSITVCGAGTDNIFIHTISTSDVTEAENLGFTDTTSLEARDASFQVIECT